MVLCELILFIDAPVVNSGILAFQKKPDSSWKKAYIAHSKEVAIWQKTGKRGSVALKSDHCLIY